MLSGRDVFLQSPTVFSHHDCVPDTLSPSFSCPDKISPLVRRLLIPDFQVSESGQHIGDKFCVVPGLIVAKKVLNDQNKSLPRFQLHLVH